MKTHWVENKTLRRRRGKREKARKEKPQTNEDNEVRFRLLETLRESFFFFSESSTNLTPFSFPTPLTTIKGITQK